MCLAAGGQGDYDAEAELAQLRPFADRYCLGPSTLCIVEAARKRNIPARRLNERSLVQLGHGIHRRRMFTAETDRTSTIAEGIAQDKELTKTSAAGRGRAGARRPHRHGCRRRLAGGLRNRLAGGGQAARRQPWPRRGAQPEPAPSNRGGLRARRRRRKRRDSSKAGPAAPSIGCWSWQTSWWRPRAASRSKSSATAGTPSRELVDQLNRDPRRGLEFAFPLGKVELDPPGLLTLEQQGYRPDSVPPAGATVIIHANGDYTTDETDEVHPDVAAQAVLAAQVIGLDVAGIDVIAANIAPPAARARGRGDRSQRRAWPANALGAAAGPPAGGRRDDRAKACSRPGIRDASRRSPFAAEEASLRADWLSGLLSSRRLLRRGGNAGRGFRRSSGAWSRSAGLVPERQRAILLHPLAHGRRIRKHGRHDCSKEGWRSTGATSRSSEQVPVRGWNVVPIGAGRVGRGEPA